MSEDVLPTSGEVIGTLIGAFGGAEDLPAVVQYMLTDRTSRRYFKGVRPRLWCCRLSALCLLLYKRGLLNLPPVTIEGKERSKEVFNLSAASELILWDHLERAPAHRRAYVRYFCIDAVARSFAVIGEATRRSGLLDAEPAWADRSRRGEPLVRMLASMEPARTNAAHAKALGFTPSVLSSWKTGKARPSREAITAMAKYFEKTGVATASTTSFALEWHYALGGVADAIARVDGSAFVKECASVVTQTVSCMAERAVEAQSDLRMRLVAWPLWRMPNAVRDAIIDHTCKHGGDEGWRRDVQAVCAEFEALVAPDDTVARNLPRHAHPFWRLPRRPKQSVPTGPSRTKAKRTAR